MKRMLLGLYVVGMISGCATGNNVIKHDSLLPRAGEAIVIFGVSQPNVKMGLTKAIVGDGLTKEISWYEGWVGGKAVNGYLPLLVKADTFYQLAPYIFYAGDERVRNYWPLDSAKTIAVNSESWKVT